MNTYSRSTFEAALKNGPYEWPGGYPLYFITSDGASLSFDAAKENKDLICESIKDNSDDGWRVVGKDVNWEDKALSCDHSGLLIESAY